MMMFKQINKKKQKKSFSGPLGGATCSNTQLCYRSLIVSGHWSHMGSAPAAA